MQIFKAYQGILKSNSVKPYIVFDGLPLPGKKEECANLCGVRQKEHENAAHFFSKGNEISARKALSKSAEIDYELVKKLLQFVFYIDLLTKAKTKVNAVIFQRIYQLAQLSYAHINWHNCSTIFLYI